MKTNDYNRENMGPSSVESGNSTFILQRASYHLSLTTGESALMNTSEWMAYSILWQLWSKE